MVALQRRQEKRSEQYTCSSVMKTKATSWMGLKRDDARLTPHGAEYDHSASVGFTHSTDVNPSYLKELGQNCHERGTD